MSNSERMPAGGSKTPEEQIQALNQELAERINALTKEYEAKIQPLRKQIEREAALDLARRDSLLMQDEATLQVIQRGGKTPEGEPIENLGDFLAERQAELKKEPGLSYGPRRKWDDLPPDAKGTPHTEE